MRRVGIPMSALCLLGAGLVATPSAWAGASGGNGTAGAGVDDTGITTTVGVGGSEGPSTSGSGGGAVPTTCGLVYIDGTDVPSLVDDSTQGYWIVDTCKLGSDPGALTWVPTTPGGPAPAPSIVAQTALSKAQWPTITVKLNPPAERMLVNFPAWLSIASGWQTIRASASTAGIRATVTARPEWVRWKMGDGHSVTCRSAGTAYDAQLSWSSNLARRDCGYTYSQSSVHSASSHFRVTVTVHYEVSWTSTTGAGGSLGGYDRNDVVSVAVGQLETLEN